MENKVESRNLFVGIVLAVITIFIWGITFVCTKYLLRQFSALEILVVRFIIAYVALWIMCPKPFMCKSISQELLFVFAGFTGVTLYQFMENTAISYTTAGNVSIIVAICPIFTAIFAQLFLHERHLSWRFVLGCIIALGGVVLVSLNGSLNFSLNPKGDILALVAAISWGVYSVFVSKINGLNLSVLQKTRRTFFWAVVFMIPLVIWGHFSNGNVQEINETTGQTAVCFNLVFNGLRFGNWLNWFNLAFLGIGASAFCFAAWNKSCAYIGTVRATLGLYMIPVVTIVFAFFVLKEQITLMGAMGAALTITGLVISSR